MPPKRQSTGASGPASKKAKTKSTTKTAKTQDPKPDTETSTSTSTETDKYEPPRSKRWAKVSASANAEANYRMLWKDEKEAYSFITLCQPSFMQYSDSDSDSDSDSEEESEEEEESDSEEQEEEDGRTEEEKEKDKANGRLGPRCEEKAKCICFLPTSLNPEHKWTISFAGFHKFQNQFIQASLRVPDNFDMYTINDHAAYGSLEVLQNLFLDYEDATREQRGGWREQWAVCEGMVHWLMHPYGMAFSQIDDGACVFETTRLVGRLFLDMLAQLDAQGLLDDVTEVKSLGCTMALYIALAASMRESDILEDDGREAYKGKNKNKLQPDYFDDAILSYANKRGITLLGPADIDELVAEAEGDIDLPTKTAKDPWGWNAALKEYKEQYAGLTSFFRATSRIADVTDIGGDSLDITTWSSAERKKASFDKKDPLGKKDMDRLKNGMVMMQG